MRLRAFVVAAGLVTLLSPPAIRVGASGDITPGSVEFLTGPNPGDPADIALAYVHRHKPDLGLTESDLAGIVATDQYTDEDTGTSHLYFQQQYQGIGVYNGILNVNVARDGNVINVGNCFVSNLAAVVNSSAPDREAHQGLMDAAEGLGLDQRQEPQMEAMTGGPAHECLFAKAGISRESIPVKLVYAPTASGAVRLAWNVTIYQMDGRHWWTANVDAATGELLSAGDYANEAGTYNVFAPPAESPLDGARTLVTNPDDALASPFGWHDTNGVIGPESTLTVGNNVHAALDVDANNVPDPGSEPNGGAGLVFDFPLDLTLDPDGYRPAAVTNLFFWNNYMHDLSYHYGFTEAAGNFQENNYGRGGIGGDSVNAEAQDGGGSDNTFFGFFVAPPDGQRGRMTMFAPNWGPAVTVHVNLPSPIAADYAAVAAAFGPPWPTAGITAAVELPSANSQGCNASDFTGFTPGNIALIDRGTCLNIVKVKNAQDAGAGGVIVARDIAGPPAVMTGSGPTITIPSAQVRQADGATFKRNLPFNATVARSAPLRDTALDNGIIAHEYTHGISVRLTGGPSNSSCLNNAEQPGEGWSDFVATVVTAKTGETATTPRPHAAYAGFGTGNRPTPYSTDLSVDPVTYDAIKSNGEVHFIGYMWASALWDMYWNLVDQYGFNANIYDAPASGGNNLALQLVIDGLKLQPCNPGFVDSRNAILLADLNRTSGANQCLIWRAFARRGLGASANQGSSNLTTDGTENFDVPANACRPDVTVSPSSLSVTVARRIPEMRTLTIGNRRAGSDDLDWVITEAQNDCSSPSDLPWLSESVASGSTAGLGNSPVTLAFNATGLTPGQTYRGLLCVSSNDPETPTIQVPISMLVTSNCCADQGPPNAGCDVASCESCVCAVDPRCCGAGGFWDSLCAAASTDPHVCAPSCSCGTCGDNVINLGEQCDEGSNNGGVSCCSASCTVRPSGDVCRPVAPHLGADFTCDVAESCGGVGTCAGGSNSGAPCVRERFRLRLRGWREVRGRLSG